MTNKNTRTFTPSDDALILEQPFTGINLKTLAKKFVPAKRCLYVGLTNLAFHLPSVMIMTGHEHAVAAINPSTRYLNG